MTLTSEFLERSVPVVTSRGSRHRGEPGKSAYFPETPGCGASGWSSVRGGPESLEEGVGAFADCKVTAVIDRVQGPSEPRTGLLGDPEAREPVIPGPYERNGHADPPELIKPDPRHVHTPQPISNGNSESSCSTAQAASGPFTQSRASASRPATGRTASRHRTASLSCRRRVSCPSRERMYGAGPAGW